MKEQIRSRALGLGFDDCRFTTAEPPASGAKFESWLADGCHGEMQWMQKNAGKRGDPGKVLEGARSVILLAAGYEHKDEPRRSDGVQHGFVARYARHSDYHDILAPRLKALSEFINALGGEGTRSLWYADTGPVLERDLGQRAGLGFVGKHTNLIHSRMGNWFIIAEILTTLPLAPDESGKNRCGTCDRCIQSCPTGAITEAYNLDARRCISYLTIELRGAIPEELRPAIGNRILGCDDCLTACPWNRFARDAGTMCKVFRPDLANLELVRLVALDEAGFKAMFAGTPIYRAKRRGLLRNVCVALGNTGDVSALPRLAKAAQDPEPLIAEHARWAIARIESKCGPA